MKVYAIRGAITVDENTEEAISSASVSLIKRIKEKNVFDSAVCILISTTADITAAYPAKAVRESGILPVRPEGYLQFVQVHRGHHIHFRNRGSL